MERRGIHMDLDTVRKVARLSRIAVTEDELEPVRAKLQSIMGFIEQLNEVNTDNVEPLSSVMDIQLPLREDAVTDGGIQRDVLANAPETMEGFFVVPKVVE